MSHGTLEEAWLAEEILGMLEACPAELALSRIRRVCEAARTPRDVRPLLQQAALSNRDFAEELRQQCFSQEALMESLRKICALPQQNLELLGPPELPNANIEGADAPLED